MASRTVAHRRDGKQKRARPTPPSAPARSEVPETVPANRSREPARLFATKNDLPETTRVEVIELLNQRLAECIGLHKLFDDINEDVEGYVDLIAERVVQLGGVAEGTVGAVEGRSTLPDYPLALATGAEHVAALSDALGAFGRTARIGIAEMDELEDADSADLLTDVSRGIDKWLWFVEAHQQEG